MLFTLPGSVFHPNKGFEEKVVNEPFFSAKIGRRSAGGWLAGRETGLTREATQKEQVMRDTPPGLSRRSDRFGVAATLEVLLLFGGFLGFAMVAEILCLLGALRTILHLVGPGPRLQLLLGRTLVRRFLEAVPGIFRSTLSWTTSSASIPQ